LQLLSKSKIISGIQCHKKLWLETHGTQDTLESHLFALGNRFGEFARIHYGEGINLDGRNLSDNVVELTNAAIANPNTNTIYEAAFIFGNVLVRVDVLKRVNDGWEMIEVKSSKEAKPHHLNDIASQAYVALGCGLKLKSMKIAHINKHFLYTGDENYSGLLVEADVTSEVIERLTDVKTWVSNLLPIVQLDSPRPTEYIEDSKCKTPYPCQFLPLCSAELPQLAEVPISILPNTGKKLAEIWGEKQIYDLRNLQMNVTKLLEKYIKRIVLTSARRWLKKYGRYQAPIFSWTLKQ